MTVSVLNYRIYLHDIHTRIPFRYGIARMTDVPHLFLQVTCEIDGRRSSGVAADNLIPKWFTKVPEQPYHEEIDQMLEVIQRAALCAQQAGRMESIFELWRYVYQTQNSWAEERGYTALLWNFGVSLVERAVVDAASRAMGVSFPEILYSNALGIRLGEVHPELAGFVPRELLPKPPLEKIHVRHTIGLADALSDGDIPATEWAADGLPESLEANIRTYGIRYFKIKVEGVLAKDRKRLKRILNVIQACDINDFAITLDGNERFQSIAAFRSYWRGLKAEATFGDMISHLLFVEQPLHRDAALSEQTRLDLLDWEDRPPIIIDESDSEIDSLKRALDCGYAGTSHKNCKGLFKGILNACLLQYRCEQDPGGCFLLSGEDLANIGPVALTQDLTVMATLGIAHVERNGHHYFRGLSMFPEALQDQVIERHADLYTKHPESYAYMKIDRGMISLGSVLAAPFGYALDLDLSCCFTPQEAWNYASLGISAG